MINSGFKNKYNKKKKAESERNTPGTKTPDTLKFIPKFDDSKITPIKKASTTTNSVTKNFIFFPQNSIEKMHQKLDFLEKSNKVVKNNDLKRKGQSYKKILENKNQNKESNTKKFENFLKKNNSIEKSFDNNYYLRNVIESFRNSKNREYYYCLFRNHFYITVKDLKSSNDIIKNKCVLQKKEKIILKKDQYYKGKFFF